MLVQGGQVVEGGSKGGSANTVCPRPSASATVSGRHQTTSLRIW